MDNVPRFDPSQVKRFTPFPHGVIVFGGHFGDEGKGKFVDIFARKFKQEYGCKILSVRGQGGGNAGHSVEADGKKYHFHYLTSAGLSADIMLLGAGMYIDPIRMFDEIKQLPEDCHCAICIDERATLSSDMDRAYDGYLEQERAGIGSSVVGTTKSGIGPGVSIKGNRDHITFADAKKCKNGFELMQKYKKMPCIPAMVKALATEEYCQELVNAVMQITLVNSQTLYQNCREEGNWGVILEVSQGMSLDPRWGNSGHFTTSTPCSDIGAVDNARLTMKDFPEGSYMVLKAYSSKVGAGPYPTKFLTMQDFRDGNTEDVLSAQEGGKWDEYIRSIVPERGVTTGRKRDLGYFDAVAVRMAIQTTGCINLCINCMDVLGTFPGGITKICYAYQHKETKQVEYVMPYHLDEYEPLYMKVPCNWGKSKDPRDMCSFIKAVEDVTGGHVAYVGVGPSDLDYCEV